MLEIMKSQVQATEMPEVKRQDIIVTKHETQVEYRDGMRIERRLARQVNITKMVNETKKLIKRDTATLIKNKVKELEKICSR